MLPRSEYCEDPSPDPSVAPTRPCEPAVRIADHPQLLLLPDRNSSQAGRTSPAGGCGDGWGPVGAASLPDSEGGQSVAGCKRDSIAFFSATPQAVLGPDLAASTARG